MADDAVIGSGASTPADLTIAADEVAGKKIQRVKVQHGADGSATDVSSASPMPVDDDAAQAILTAIQGLLAGTLTVTGGGGGTEFAEDAAHSSGALGSMPLAVRTDAAVARATTDGDYIPLITDSSGRLWVNVGALPALPAGTNNIGDVDVLTLPALPAGTNNIGDVDVLSSALPTGASTAAKQPALGTAGSASADVISVQGRAGMTPLDVAGTIAVSGTMPVQFIQATTATLANVSGSASSVTLIALNTNRLGFSIWNDSAAILYVKFGSSASATSCTYKLTPDATLDSSAMPFRYTGIITGIWTSATGAARTTEMTA